MPGWKRILTAPAMQRALGVAAAEYLRLVWLTSRSVIEPADIYRRIEPDLPLILTTWHGRHFLMPFARRPEHRAKVLVSLHRDGAINAAAAERLGIGTIRGSGSHDGDFNRKGGVGAYRAMLDALAQGCNVALTADVPKVSRIAGPGVIRLARDSGRKIYPVAIACSRSIVLDNWDRTTIPLPFGRIAACIAEPISVASEASDEEMESARVALGKALDEVALRAEALARGDAGPKH